jgi:UDP-N-acetylmuramoyl-tripeptide--D-alanyl-D-alanine ligase
LDIGRPGGGDGGRVPGDWSVTGVSIDSRTVAPGDLFVALTDARDGHDFVADALAKGAAAALVSRLPDGVDPAHLLIVDDVLAALTRRRRAARARMTGHGHRCHRVGGQDHGEGDAAHRPVAAGPHPCRRGVLQQPLGGAADAGADACRYRVRGDRDRDECPRRDRAFVAAGRARCGNGDHRRPAHLEAFGALEGIAHEKASIFDGLKPGGMALAHADIDTAPILFDKARAMGARLIRFGEADGVEAQLTDLRLAQDATVVKARIGGADRLFKIGAPGRHLAVNALIAMTVVDALGLDLTQAGMALAGWEPVGGRGTRHRIAIDPGSAARHRPDR